MDERFDVPSTSGILPEAEPREMGASGFEGESSKSGMSQAAAEGKEKARRLGSAVRQRAAKVADQRKGFLASELENFAGALDEFSGSLEQRGRSSQQQWVGNAAGMLRRTSRQLRDSSSEQLVSRASDQVRAKPGVFLAGCFAVGFLAARLLKS